jgi:hypothetical protein
MPASQRLNRHHLAQFYEDEAMLSETAADFIVSGLEVQEPVLVIAVHEHQSAMDRVLASHGWNCEGLIRDHKLIMMDAHETLDCLTSGGKLNEKKFMSLMTALLRGMPSALRGRPRIYGEITHLLGSAQRWKDCLRVEELWNDLSEFFQFSVLCPYQSSYGDDGLAWEDRAKIQALHAQVLSAGGAATHGNDQRIQQLFMVEHEARSLHDELARRVGVERSLRSMLIDQEEVLAHVGHELRTPLTGLKLKLTALERTSRDDVLCLERTEVERLVAQVDRLIEVVEELGRLRARKDDCP